MNAFLIKQIDSRSPQIKLLNQVSQSGKFLSKIQESKFKKYRQNVFKKYLFET